jgi:hypothetical protein
VPVAEAKTKVVAAIRDGVSVRDAMALVDRREATYLDWRKNDKVFAAQVDEVRDIARSARERGAGGRVEVPDFPEFCEQYLDKPLPLHHLRVWDVLNGREPREMHPAIRFQVGRDNRVLLNFPPYHAKTAVWSVNYCVWRIIRDPNVRIAVVSKTQDLAKKIVAEIKQILTMPQYAKLHAAFMPEGGWKGESWTRTAIYLAGTTTAQKDPTLQALGLGSQVYGSRLDVILLDDLVDMENVHDFEKQADKVGTEYDSRVDDNGILICLGTRFGATDLYSELRDKVDWDGEAPMWTYFAQPAVFDTPDPDPNSWITLWPAMWPGMALAKKKAPISDQRWQTTYQQQDASFVQTFPSQAVRASINNSRAAGPMDGLYCVLGVDPAAAGKTAMVVLGLDKVTKKRYVLDGFNMGNCPPAMLIAKIKEFVEKYRCREAVIERNGFQGFLSRNEELREFMYAHQCLLTEHWTGSVKWDEDLGVQSLAPLFLSCATHDPKEDRWEPVPDRAKHLIDLPNPRFSTFVEDLVVQLGQWQPRAKLAKGQLTDLVMALWFASIGIQKVLDHAKAAPKHMHNPFLPRAEQRQRSVVNLAQLAEATLAAAGTRTYDAYTGSLA